MNNFGFSFINYSINTQKANNYTCFLETYYSSITTLAASFETATDESNGAGDEQEDGDDNTDEDIELSPVFTGSVQFINRFVTVLNEFHANTILNTVFCPLKHKEILRLT